MSLILNILVLVQIVAAIAMVLLILIEQKMGG